MLAAEFEDILEENKKKNDISIDKIRAFNKKFSEKIKEIFSIL